MKELTRRALYDLVWAKPMTELAKEFGVSDVALHKICKKHRIGTPERGYWAKVAAGKPVTQVAFEDLPNRIRPTIRIFPSHILALPPEIKEMREKARKQKQEQKANPAPVSLSDDLPPCVERMKRKLETVQMQKKECIVLREAKYFSVSITPALVPRLLIVLEKLVNDAEKQGYKIEAGESAQQLNVEGEVITIHIFEKTDKIPHVPTEKEVSALQKWEKECEEKRKRKEWVSEWDKPKIPEFDYPFNGKLVIELDKAPYHGDGIQRKFSDRKNTSLEVMIGDVLTGAAMCAAQMKNERAERERREKEWAERKRLEEIERRRQRLEEKRIKDLDDNLNRWRRSIEIRAFADAAEARLRAENVEDSAAKKKAEDWLVWARGYANEIDPVLNSVPALIYDKDFNRWEL